MKKIRIINATGLAHDTVIEDADTGEPLEGITAIEMAFGVSSGRLIAQLTQDVGMLNVHAEAEITPVCPCCGQVMPEVEQEDPEEKEATDTTW